MPGGFAGGIGWRIDSALALQDYGSRLTTGFGYGWPVVELVPS